MNIVVLLGGISPERNISLLSGRAAVEALRLKGHTVTAVDPSKGANGILSQEELDAATAREVTAEELAAFRLDALNECISSDVFNSTDIVFICLHGKYGEDGYIQALLDLRGIRYTGSGMLASAMCMDKAVTKLMFQVAGIPTPHWASIKPNQAADDEAIRQLLKEVPGKLVVKPNDQGSTVGMTILEENDADGLRKAIQLAGQFSELVLIEEYIPGRELTVAVLGGEALPIIEIEPTEGYYDYANKYTKGKTLYHCPAELSEEVQHHVMNLAVTAHEIMGCKGYSRIDFRLSPENYPYCLEVNTIPGFTATSLVPMAARECGIEFPELCEEVVRLALEN